MSRVDGTIDFKRYHDVQVQSEVEGVEFFCLPILLSHPFVFTQCPGSKSGCVKDEIHGCQKCRVSRINRGQSTSDLVRVLWESGKS